MLVSGVQHSDLGFVLFLFLVILHYRLLQDIEYNARCHPVNPCTLSILYMKVKVLVAQSCPILWDPMYCNLPGFSVHGIFQARIVAWIAILFRGSSQPGGGLEVPWAAGSFCMSRQGSPVCVCTAHSWLVPPSPCPHCLFLLYTCVWRLHCRNQHVAIIFQSAFLLTLFLKRFPYCHIVIIFIPLNGCMIQWVVIPQFSILYLDLQQLELQPCIHICICYKTKRGFSQMLYVQYTLCYTHFVIFYYILKCWLWLPNLFQRCNG